MNTSKSLNRATEAAHRAAFNEYGRYVTSGEGAEKAVRHAIETFIMAGGVQRAETAEVFFDESKKVDWREPIQFENGESCTYGGMANNFEGHPIIINRKDVSGISSVWFYPVDGKSIMPGYNVINVSKDGGSK